MFACAVTAFTQDNDFPLYFHPDESGKVKQLVEHRFNFNHPQLLLDVTEVSARVMGMHEPDQIAVVGRTVSAVMAGIAVVVFTLIGWRLRQWTGALAVGVFVLLNPTLGYLAHFLKEDCALLMGLAFSLLALVYYLDRQTWLRLVLLGLCCGIAASAKYLGAITIAAGLAVVLLGPRPRINPLKAAGAFILTTSLTGLILNYLALFELANAKRGLKRELTHAASGHGGFSLEVPHLLYLEELKLISPFVLVFAAVYLVGFAAGLRRRLAGEWAVTLFPFIFFAILCFSRLINIRYFLPVSAGLTLLAGLGVADLVRWAQQFSSTRRDKAKHYAAAGIVAALALLLTPGFYHDTVEIFRNDPRFALRDWVSQNLPPEAIIAQQPHIGLADHEGNPDPDYAPKLRQQVIILGTFPRDIMTFRELVDRGVTHFVLISGRYQIFDDPHDPLAADRQAMFLKHRDFYHQVLAHSVLVWSSDYPHGVHRIARTKEQANTDRRLNEKLEVYELRL